MIELVLASLYFILPAYFANMCATIFAKIKVPFTGKNFPLGQPINEKLFGSHKTWRGFYAGYLGALVILVGQFYLQKNGIVSPTLLDYQNINLFLYAFLFGVGAIAGDTIKSFFKRRIGIRPGQPWPPFDQLDFVIGALVFMAPFYWLPWQNLLVIFLITPILHLLVNVFAYFLGLKKVWW